MCVDPSSNSICKHASLKSKVVNFTPPCNFAYNSSIFERGYCSISKHWLTVTLKSPAQSLTFSLLLITGTIGAAHSECGMGSIHTNGCQLFQSLFHSLPQCISNRPWFEKIRCCLLSHSHFGLKDDTISLQEFF